jgi:acetoin utilization protein AcuB
VRVAERMTPTVVTIRRDTTATTAWALMKVRRFRHLPVVDDRGRIVGIVSDRDLTHVPSTPTRAGQSVPTSVPVERIMTAMVISVRPDDDIAEAARLMWEHKIGALPVVENDRLVGIISELDLLRMLSQNPRSAQPPVIGHEP